ncbi:4-hydroxy-3-methylbut-2-enyl diphosphate reductase [candidate division KSB1 bacterium]|nr:4-hydroxy-3-methylbut-2-enyl diphosphate reductase [candidate division KSB1 bacterium]
MRIEIDRNAGVCPGVLRAIRLCEDELKKNGELIAVGPIIHNSQEVERLASLGLRTIKQDTFESNDEWREKYQGKRLFIRTHGISPTLRGQFEVANCELIDGTCPTVLRSQKWIDEYAKDGYQIVIIGKPTHAEVLALKGAAPGVTHVAMEIEDLSQLDFQKKTMVIAQTTINQKIFEELTHFLKLKVNNLVIKNTICRAVNLRHENLREFAASVDMVLFVGGRHSSNTNELFQICLSRNPDSHLIESPEEIQIDWLKNVNCVGISGSASTPLWQMEQVKAHLVVLDSTPI